MSTNSIFGGDLPLQPPTRQLSPSRSVDSNKPALQEPFNLGCNSSQSSPTMAPSDPSSLSHYNSFTPIIEMPQQKLNFETPTGSQPHTPLEQSPPMLLNGVDFSDKKRFGSVSSIATTDDEDNNVNEILYPWNDEQDALIKKIYEDLINKPNITPFSGNIPPSGIVHRVSKDTLRMAKHKKIYFPHSMDATRHRLVHLCASNKQEINFDDLEKYTISQDYFSMAPTPNYNNFGEDDFEFVDASERKMSIEEKYVLRPHQQQQSQQQPVLGQALGPAFKEPQCAPSPPVFNPNFKMTDEDIVNVVAKRKRDSLRMKRGPR